MPFFSRVLTCAVVLLSPLVHAAGFHGGSRGGDDGVCSGLTTEKTPISEAWCALMDAFVLMWSEEGKCDTDIIKGFFDEHVTHFHPGGEKYGRDAVLAHQKKVCDDDKSNPLEELSLVAPELLVTDYAKKIGTAYGLTTYTGDHQGYTDGCFRYNYVYKLESDESYGKSTTEWKVVQLQESIAAECTLPPK